MTHTEQTTARKHRNSSVELLRFVFMFSIVIDHIYGHGSGLDYELIYNWGKSFPDAIHLMLFSFGKIGVTGFIFISGYYGIRMNRRKWIDLLLMVTFYAMLCPLLVGKKPGSISLVHAFDQYWFVGSYVFICIIAPLVECAFKHLDEITLRRSIIGVLLFTYFAHFIQIYNSHDTEFLLSVYLIARYIKIHPFSLFVKYKLSICTISFMIILMLPVALRLLGIPCKGFLYLFSNNNIILLTFCASLILLADKYYFENKLVNYLSSSVLAIYLITDNNSLRIPLDTALLPSIMQWFGYVTVFILCVMCLVIEKVRAFCFNYVLDKLNINK